MTDTSYSQHTDIEHLTYMFLFNLKCVTKLNFVCSIDVTVTALSIMLPKKYASSMFLYLFSSLEIYLSFL